jgi:hypothetical protein
MTQLQWLLLPAFVHVALVFYVLFQTGRGRVAALKSRQVKLSDVDTNKNAYPETVRNFANNYANQFELPMLFYAALAFIVALGLADWVFVGLSWIFIASRILHTVVHTGKNVITQRFQVFGFGLLNLGLLWGWLALRFFVIG